MDVRFSERAKAFRASEIRNKLFDNPEIITFAAGKPEGSLFPTKEILPLLQDVMEKKGELALQYSDTEGLLSIREIIAYKRMKAAGVVTTPDSITLTSGSQEGIELSAKIFVNEGDTIILESPSYVGAFNAFQSYNPKYVGIPMDNDGIIIEKLEEALISTPSAKMIYTIPDFQNPTGITMSNDRRRKLAELGAKYKIPIIEDCPYGDLIYEGTRHPSVKSFDEEGWVVTLGSFSKTFCPGLRLAWVCASEEILKKYTLAKQASNLQCSTLDERITISYMLNYNLEKHIDKVRACYRERRDLMLKCIDMYFPKGIKYTNPHGGFFVWLELKESIDAGELLLEAARKAKVAFVPGGPFFAEPGHNNFIRLSYSFVGTDKIEEGMKRLGALLHEYY